MSASTPNFPKLGATNYPTWSGDMEAFLKACGLFFFFFEINFYIPGHNGSPVASYAQVILQLPTHASNYET
jgi:hypothetical protein